jgi:lipid II:glycine glycyltransferase (peptidoglycan interpeptide bridge formation enzyme)
MVKIESVESREVWDGFVANRPEANCLQSWSIMESHAAMGQEIIRRAAMENGKIIGVYSGFVDKAKKGVGLVIAGGPLVDLSKKSVVKMMLTDMKNEGKRLGCDFVRLRPQWEDGAESRAVLREGGAKKAPFYLSVEHAGVLDISGTEEEIMATFRQKARRAIRKALAADLDISVSQDVNEIDEFYKIELDHAKRQGYVPFGKKFLKTQFQVFAEHNEAELFIARKDREVLAENLMIFYGSEASYLYGVSTRLGTEYSAAPLLHLLAIREAKKRGITRYNFWGIVDEDDTAHRFYGVSVFKRGFGVSELKYTPAHDIVINPLRYYAFIKPLETIRRKRRKV